jgi:hypothetical protein
MVNGRGFVKAMGAASFRKGDASGSPASQTPIKMQRHDSSSSINTNGSAEEKKKKSLFRRKNSA